MPKIVDHDERRDQIALVACRVVAENGFDQATIVRIAREAGYTTGMVAHYFDTKQDIIIAALRLILRRIEERLTKPSTDLLALLSEALPIDEQRFIECAFWSALSEGWDIWEQLCPATRERVLRSVVTFINGLTASAVPSQSDWPAAKQVEQLRLQLELLHAWAQDSIAAPSKKVSSWTSR
jgi:AcrR family transcriptional regulator